MKRIIITALIATVCGFSYGQEKLRKTNIIIDSLKIVESQKSALIEFGINPLKYEATGNDSLKLIELENRLTDQEIRSRIVHVFDQTFTDREINTLYDFLTSPAYVKFYNLLGSSSIPDQFKDIAAELNLISNSTKAANEDNDIYEGSYIDRQDGFYATVDYEPDAEKETIRLEEIPSITKDDIQSVEKEIDGRGMQIIAISLTEEGAKKFYLLTKNNIAKPIAIVVDQQIISMPRIVSEISGGKLHISGNFSTAEIDRIIEKLK